MNIQRLPIISMKIISVYAYWHNITRHIPKMRRYSLGVKIDSLFTDIIELVSMAQFSPKEERQKILSRAITKNDCLKSMLYVLFELESIEEKYFLELGQKIEEIGKMLYGWKNQTEKQNRPVEEKRSPKQDGNDKK